MKLLGWMHRKFRANEPLKDFSIGNSCTCLSGQPSLDDQQYYPKLVLGETVMLVLEDSYVSTGRSSHGSTITLSGKPLEGTETSGNGTTICPLQGYLFGSAIELPETTTVVKKEHRTSLGELFQRTKIAEENYVAKSERGEKRTEKETDKSAIHLMKKMLKKRMVHGSSRSSTTSTGGNVDSASSETKLHKTDIGIEAELDLKLQL
ncbi:LOW QUALITY PROTEIN: protein LAZY 1-like [Camellia sinensis]|uniref:LOW QUALITY PROTEIN: protein LAZY 1-like n=1 Tax=Camellia sinensis TaxID=4442 RepID=UPI001036B003|nr:LOW QUALITY PROTEIN: protein LAZY 1-like [Camellia sinensis]